MLLVQLARRREHVDRSRPAPLFARAAARRSRCLRCPRTGLRCRARPCRSSCSTLRLPTLPSSCTGYARSSRGPRGRDRLRRRRASSRRATARARARLACRASRASASSSAAGALEPQHRRVIGERIHRRPVRRRRVERIGEPHAALAVDRDVGRLVVMLAVEQIVRRRGRAVGLELDHAAPAFLRAEHRAVRARSRCRWCGRCICGSPRPCRVSGSNL